MKNLNYVYIETYGCSANQNNSEILAGLLRSAGYQITNNEKVAEIIIINSCVVKSKTENKIKRRIQDLSKQKNKLLIIAGCMPETDAKQIKQLNEKVIFLGTHHYKDIAKLISNYKDNKLDLLKQNEFLENKNEEKLFVPKISSNNLISITQISEGCLGKCTYCKTRLAKGQLYSYDSDKIIQSIENDLTSGAKEVWITSQDCANYGLDRGKSELISLLKKILELKHNFKLRLGMSDPNNIFPILNELIEVYKNKKMYKFLHIPIQSASNKVLKDMNRFYTIEQVEKIIKEFRKQIPDITISTDIIVGYPTETEADHKENLKFIRQYSPDVFNLSKMSIHKGTQASKLKPLNINIINKRTTELMDLHKQTALENKQKFLNKNIKVFVNKKLEGELYEARDDNYNIVLLNSKDKGILGKNIDVKIKQIGIHHMIGEII
ncbi:MAG: tRNA (N(6)-L-threonylcarbamoyladenosine(37)-C(2))-methylthiotransferase [Candidatus Pacearchaeota archaeon]|jgi:MiaB-like tRNA modifying enzyme